MRRRPVTMVVLAARRQEATPAFLSRLARTLRPGDDVVAVAPGTVPRALAGWRSVATNGLSRSTHLPRLGEVVVLVDERATPVGAWLDPLVVAARAPGVAAAAPRTNISAGDDLLVGVPYRPQETAVLRKLVAARAATRAAITDARWLDGAALALEREVFECAGGFGFLLEEAAQGGCSPIGALARRARARGRLVVAEASYLHHAGGPHPWGPRHQGPCGPESRPLVSACLIARDEHANIGRCLDSLRALADEVLVYDTGSVDDTQEIARSAGATVVGGHWDEDFGRARNDALAHCSGQWVLWIDADEELAAPDPSALRRRLADAPATLESGLVMVDNVRGTEVATARSHPACRLFRRAYGQWVGRLHEQVIARAGTEQLVSGIIEGVRITHWGYLSSAISGRGKPGRNTTIAIRDLLGPSKLPKATRLVSLARSYVLEQRYEDGLACCRAALRARPTRGVARLARGAAIEALVGMGRFDEAMEEIARLRATLVVQSAADLQEGRVLLLEGRFEEALRAFARVRVGTDDEGFEHDAAALAAYRAGALIGLGRDAEAADVLLDGLALSGTMDASVETLARCLERSGRALAEIPRAVPQARAVLFLSQLVGSDPELADRTLEAWHEVAPSRAVLATAVKVSNRLRLERRTAWSDRLRAGGLGFACPLVASSADAARDPADRLLAAALAFEHFGDPRGEQAFVALSICCAHDVDSLRARVAHLAPSLARRFGSICDAVAAGAGGLGTGGPAAGRLERATCKGGSSTSSTRSVLLVDRAVASLRTMALAGALARHGHDVVVVHPEPVAGTAAVLSASGACVSGVAQDDPAALIRRVAEVGAERAFHAVVVARDAAGLRAQVRRLLPAAEVVVDAPGAGSGPPTSDVLRVLLGADPNGLDPAWMARNGLSERDRRGICIAGDFRSSTDEERAEFQQVIAPSITRALEGFSVAVLGDDPGARAARELPGSLAIGAGSDPAAWLAGARAVLVAVRSGAEAWLALAAASGTPALFAGQQDPARLARVLRGLADPALQELWFEAAASVPKPAVPKPAVPSGCGSPAPATGKAARGEAAAPLLSGHARTCALVDWGYGKLPVEWLGPIRDVVDELWVCNDWARAQAVRSGIPPRKVRVLPTRVDTALFSPDPGALRRGGVVTILFAGDCTPAGGVDCLLEVYRTEFSEEDGVRLLLARTRGAPCTDLVELARRGEGAPVEIVDLPSNLAARAALYRSCDLFVHVARVQETPVRLLEAMACGMATVVLEGGSSGSFADKRTSFCVEARQVARPPETLGCLGPSTGLFWLEPDRESLAKALRDAVSDPDMRLVKGLSARGRALRRFS